jgi:hypothetical protein
MNEVVRVVSGPPGQRTTPGRAGGRAGGCAGGRAAGGRAGCRRPCRGRAGRAGEAGPPPRASREGGAPPRSQGAGGVARRRAGDGAAPPQAGRGGGAAAVGRGGGAAPPANGEGRCARAGKREGARRGRRGGRGRERRRGGEGSSPQGPNSGDRRLQSLGHHGEREVEEGEGGCCTGNPNERERRGRMGGCGCQGRAGPGRARPGWVGLGWAEPLRRSKPTTCTTTKRIKSRIEIQNGTRRTRNIRQRNVLRHDATPMTLRFWFIHDTDTCHYTGLKLGRGSEAGKRKESNARIW